MVDRLMLQLLIGLSQILLLYLVIQRLFALLTLNSLDHYVGWLITILCDRQTCRLLFFLHCLTHNVKSVFELLYVE